MTVATKTVPDFLWPTLLLMVAGGISGGAAGRALNKRMDNKAVDKLFIVLTTAIIFISIFNAWQYMQ